MSSLISGLVSFSDSDSLLNSTFLSWIVFIQPLVLSVFIHILIRVLEHLHRCYFEVLVLCSGWAAFPRPSRLLSSGGGVGLVHPPLKCPYEQLPASYSLLPLPEACLTFLPFMQWITQTPSYIVMEEERAQRLCSFLVSFLVDVIKSPNNSSLRGEPFYFSSEF